MMSKKLSNFSDLSRPVRSPMAMAAMALLLTLTLLGPAMTTLRDSESGAGNAVRQLGYALVFGLAVVAMRPLKHPERLAVVPWFLWVPLAWCWLSLSWALDPAVAVRRIVLTTIVIWSVFALVRQLGVERTLLFVRVALITILVVNYAVVLMFPAVGLHNLGSEDQLLIGKWRGLMGHKNQAGLVCALTIVFFSFDRRKFPFIIPLSVILFSILFLWFSASKTSLAIVFIAVGVGFGVLKYKNVKGDRRRLSSKTRNAMLMTISLSLIPLIHFGVQSDIFLNYIADSSGLTGRTKIWADMMRYYLKNPIFSAGYGSFWNIGNASPMLVYGQGWVQQVAEGHNGYLDLLITIGLPGLVLVLVAMFIIPGYRLVSEHRLSGATYALIASIIFFCFGHNFTESSLFDRDAIGQVFLLIALGMLWTGEADDRGEMSSLGRLATQGNSAIALNRRARVRADVRSSGRNPGV